MATLIIIEIIIVFYLAWDYPERIYVHKEYKDTRYLLLHKSVKDLCTDKYEYCVLKRLNGGSLRVVNKEFFDEYFEKIVWKKIK